MGVGNFLVVAPRTNDGLDLLEGFLDALVDWNPSTRHCLVYNAASEHFLALGSSDCDVAFMCEACKVEHCPGCWEAPVAWLGRRRRGPGIPPRQPQFDRLPTRQALWEMLVNRRWLAAGPAS